MENMKTNFLKYLILSGFNCDTSSDLLTNFQKTIIEIGDLKEALEFELGAISDLREELELILKTKE